MRCLRSLVEVFCCVMMFQALIFVSCAEVAPPKGAVKPPPLWDAQSAVVHYAVDGAKKTITLDRADAVKLADLLKPIRTDDLAPAGGGARVQFVLPDGKTFLLLMIEADLVWVEGWGMLELPDRAFHDHAKGLVEKHAGKKVDLVP